jgi:hypothetical protein
MMRGPLSVEGNRRQGRPAMQAYGRGYLVLYKYFKYYGASTNVLEYCKNVDGLYMHTDINSFYMIQYTVPQSGHTP